MKKITSLLLIFYCAYAYPQKINRHLQKEIAELITGFHGGIGVYVHDLKRNRVVSINAEDTFPTASMVKIPILTGIMTKIEKGELAYHQEMIYKDSLLYAGVDILGSFKNNEKIELSKVMMLMLSMSDNTASLWLQSLAGGGAVINNILDSNGFSVTRVNSRTTGRETNRGRFGWGQTSPKEIATLMEKISKHEIISYNASEKMLRLLGRNYWDEVSVSQIPSDVFVASKNGAVDESRSEVAFVNGKKCRYIFSICTKNNADKSWTDNNEAWVLTRKLSALLWKYFND
ncbi:MAG: serine hydrolase [Chitinophagaceae bacterium]|nr:serine hydrolase [Chitinophagaceae bacterium]